MTPSRAVNRVGVIGAGTMGGGIAIGALTGGFSVTLVDTADATLAQGIKHIHARLDESTRKGRLEASAGQKAKDSLCATTDLAALAKMDLVIEAVFESLSVKRALFAELGARCRAGAVLATNTSSLDVDAIAAASGRAADVLGMHFFSPADRMRLVEIVRGGATAPEVIATALAVAQRLGKIGVVVGNAFGFVGNRMLYAYGRERELMLLEGASPEQIDSALESFGMAMGPHAVSDLSGIDIGCAARRGWRERPDDPRYYRISDLLVERGRLGRKVGRGFYDYAPEARRGTPAPVVAALIRAEAARLGVAQRSIGDEEIVERCMLGLIIAGAWILDEGVAARSSDIDVIWCNGYGFPRERGGPMRHADGVGLHHILDRTRHYASRLDPRYWRAPPLLEFLARSGRSFKDWAPEMNA